MLFASDKAAANHKPFHSSNIKKLTISFFELLQISTNHQCILCYVTHLSSIDQLLELLRNLAQSGKRETQTKPGSIWMRETQMIPDLINQDKIRKNGRGFSGGGVRGWTMASNNNVSLKKPSPCFIISFKSIFPKQPWHSFMVTQQSTGKGNKFIN